MTKEGAVVPDRQLPPIDEFPWMPPEEPPTDELNGVTSGKKTLKTSRRNRRPDLVAGAIGLAIGLVLGLAVGSIGGPVPDDPGQYPAEQTELDEEDARHAVEAELRESLEDANQENARLRHELRVAKARARAAAIRAARARKRGSEQPNPTAASTFMPPPGWTTDALTPGYTGCRQGYPGGRINGVYVWKPIHC